MIVMPIESEVGKLYEANKYLVGRLKYQIKGVESKIS